MPVTVITYEDLQSFKRELVEEIQKIPLEQAPKPNKKWLRSREVRQLLCISPATLQKLRINEILPYTKVGSVFYYGYEDIQKVLENNSQNDASNRFSR